MSKLHDMLTRTGLRDSDWTALRRALPYLGTFSLGVLMGAGAALLLTPASGPELRRAISGRQGRGHFLDEEAMHEQMSWGHLLDWAQRLGVEQAQEMSRAELIGAIRRAG